MNLNVGSLYATRGGILVKVVDIFDHEEEGVSMKIAELETLDGVFLTTCNAYTGVVMEGYESEEDILEEVDAVWKFPLYSKIKHPESEGADYEIIGRYYNADAKESALRMYALLDLSTNSGKEILISSYDLEDDFQLTTIGN